MWIQRLFRRSRQDQQLEAELSFHLEQLAQELMRKGVPEEEARRQAALQFGGKTQVAEECREARGTARVESVFQDLRYAVRVLAKTPSVTITAVLALALAIGANTVIFSGVHALLLKPLPFPQEQNLFMVHGRIPGQERVRFSPREFTTWQAGQRAFSAFGAFAGNGFTLTGRGEPVALFGTLATPGLFKALDVPAARGRVLSEAESHAGNDHVVVLSDTLWRAQFGADENVLGQSIYLNGESYTVIGVMPPEFIFPTTEYQFWVPAALDSGIFQKFPDAHMLRTVGRLASGVSTAQLAAEVEVLGKRIAELDTSSKRTTFFTSLAEETRGPVRKPLLALMAAVGFVLLIACANVASILLARGTARNHEFAVRVALGAARFRLVQQLVIESMLLALVGGTVGVVLAFDGVRILKSFGAAGLPGIEVVQVNAPVLLFALGVSVATGLVFGIVPALLASQRAASDGLREGRWSTRDHSTKRAQHALVAMQVALSVILLAGAGLFARSFVRLSSTSPGFRPDHVLTASVALDERSYPREDQMLGWTRTVMEQARSIPGVDAVALATHMPFSGQGWGNGYEVEGRPPEPGKEYIAQIRPVTFDYFRTLGIPVREGEPFTERDVASAPGVAIVNETLARRFWPDGGAVGRRIRIDDDWRTIRGVLGDIKHARLDAESDPEVYVPYEQLPPSTMKFLGRGLTLVVHGSLDPVELESSVRNAIRNADPTLAIRDVKPLERMVADSFAQPRFRTTLLGAFSTIALVLAAIGIYGAMSYLVAQRLQEIGLRLALGAPRGTIMRMVVQRALTITAAGVVAGLLGAAMLVSTLRGLLFGVTTHDPLAFTIAPLVILAIALVASLAPAVRAARADPLWSLRAE